MKHAARNGQSAILRWWREHVVEDVNYREVIARVHDESCWSGHFAFMTMISAGIAILGLLLSSPAVVIGAMLISPLMGPIIGFGFGLALFDLAEIKRASLAIGLGIVLAVAFGAFIVLVSPFQEVTSEIAARTRPNLFDLGVAIFSGLGGTYATIRGRHGAIVGVAIAVAVMPPLAVVGFGLATLNMPVLWGAAFLFLTNLMAIGFSAAVLARLYGFGSQLSPRQSWLQASLIIGTLVALAVPLAIALRQIAWETLATREARAAVTERFAGNARISELELDFDARPIRVSAVVFTPAYRPRAEEGAALRLAAVLDKPVAVQIEQMRVGGESADAAQLAEARGAAADRAAHRVAERLALVAGVTPDRVLVDRERRIARVRAVPMRDTGLAGYRQLETNVMAMEKGWTILLIPPPAPFAPVPALTEPESAELKAALDTAAWAHQRLATPIGVRGAGAEKVAERLRAAGADARALPPFSGPARLDWLAPGE